MSYLLGDRKNEMPVKEANHDKYIIKKNCADEADAFFYPDLYHIQCHVAFFPVVWICPAIE